MMLLRKLMRQTLWRVQIKSSLSQNQSRDQKSLASHAVCQLSRMAVARQGETVLRRLELPHKARRGNGRSVLVKSLL